MKKSWEKLIASSKAEEPHVFDIRERVFNQLQTQLEENDESIFSVQQRNAKHREDSWMDSILNIFHNPNPFPIAALTCLGIFAFIALVLFTSNQESSSIDSTVSDPLEAFVVDGDWSGLL